MFPTRSLFLAFTASLLSTAHALEVKVSPALTLPQALNQIREARKGGDNTPATILLPEGITELTQPLQLEAQDSNLTITGSQSTLIGAPVVTGWEKHEGQIMKADVSKLLPKGFVPKQLLSNGERQILARYPNFDAKDPLYGGWAFVAEFPPAGAPEGHLWKRTLYVKPEDVRTWAHPEDVELDIFAQYGWWNFVEPVVSLDPQTRMLTLKKDCGYDLHPHNRYHFQNALEELDAPGEWFYDKRSGVLYFWPKSSHLAPRDEPSATAGKDGFQKSDNDGAMDALGSSRGARGLLYEIRVPVLESFFKVKAGARNIVIRGLIKECILIGT